METMLEENDYQYVKTLKKGIRSTIIQAKKDDKEYAVRAIKDLHNYVNAARAAREILLLTNCKHENIIEMIDILVDSKTDIKKVYIVMPLMHFTLKEFIEQMQWRDENASYYIRHIMTQIFKGLIYLHANNIIHRDLKPRNIMMNKNNQLKIIDFEVSREIILRDNFYAQNERLSYLAQYSYITSANKISPYEAPERLLALDHYDSKVDIWSAGAIFAELAWGYSFPDRFLVDYYVYQEFCSNTSLNSTEIPNRFKLILPQTYKDSFMRFLYERQRILETAKFKFPSPNPDDDNREAHSAENGYKILENLLVLDPEKRWSAAQALQSEFFSVKNLNVDTISNVEECQNIFDEINTAIDQSDDVKLQNVLKSQIEKAPRLRRDSVGIWQGELATRFKSLLGNVFCS